MWRATLLSAVLAALAGCSVETEGAACTAPGTTSECPEGQACGVDLRCSKNPQLVCPAPGAEIAVDPGATAIEGIAPTGWAGNEACRFRTLADALGVATGVATVKIYGRGAPLTIDLGATLPVVLPSGVTLTTNAASPTPSDFILQATPGTADVLHLENGAAVRGVTVRSGGATGDVVEVVCGSAAVNVDAVLDTVVVDGGGAAARGVVVAGACHLAATGLEVRGVAGDGLAVAATGSGGADVTGLDLHDNDGHGALVTSGRLYLTGTATGSLISANGSGGVRLDGAAVNASLDGVRITGNQGVGLYVNAISSSSVSVVRALIARNDATLYGPVPQQTGGGIILRSLPPPTFTLTRTVVCNNQGDELGIHSSSAWSIAGPDTGCGVVPSLVNNHIGDASGGRLVYTTSGAVNAGYTFWSEDPPTTGPSVNTEPSCGLRALPPECD